MPAARLCGTARRMPTARDCTQPSQVKLHEAQEAALKEALREAERSAARVAKSGSGVDMEYLKNTVIKVGGFWCMYVTPCGMTRIKVLG